MESELLKASFILFIFKNKMLWYLRSIFLIFFLWLCLVTDGSTNLLLGNHTNMLLVYQDVTLKWASQLSFIPVAVRVANYLWV